MQTASNRHRGFTLIELLVVIAIIALLIGILLPALGRARTTAVQLKNNTQLRGIHQGLVIHAANNKGWYTGYDAGKKRWLDLNRDRDEVLWRSGLNKATFPQARFSEMIALDLVTPELLIHPAERFVADAVDPGIMPIGDPPQPVDKIVWTGEGDRNLRPYQFDERFYSYAVNEIAPEVDEVAQASDANKKSFARYAQAREAWKDNMSDRTIVVSDRVYGIEGNNIQNQYNFEKYIGFYSERQGDSEIGVQFNDGHVEYSKTPIIKNTLMGRYRNTSDIIFSRGDDYLVGSADIPENLNEIFGPVPMDDPLALEEGTSFKMNHSSWSSWDAFWGTDASDDF